MCSLIGRFYEYLYAHRLTVLVGPLIWFLPHTEARFAQEMMALLAIFTATIVGFILGPWPTGIMALFGIVEAVATNSITMVQALGVTLKPM